MSSRVVVAGVAAVIAGCTISAPLGGKECPCLDGWHCDETGHCAPGAAPAPDAAADTGGDDAGADRDAADAGPSAVPTVRRLASPPELGVGLDWYPAYALFDFTAAYRDGDNTVAAYGAWDDAALYLAVRVTDSDLYAVAPVLDDTRSWRNDAIELLFDTQLRREEVIAPGDANYRQWIYTIAGAVFDAYGACSGADPSFVGTAEFHLTLFGVLNGPGTGYLVEVRLPWADLLMIPQPGTELGFDLVNDDRDLVTATTALAADWQQLMSLWKQPVLWGRLRLGE